MVSNPLLGNWSPRVSRAHQFPEAAKRMSTLGPIPGAPTPCKMLLLDFVPVLQRIELLQQLLHSRIELLYRKAVIAQLPHSQ